MIENDRLKHQLKYAPNESKDLKRKNFELSEQVEFLTHQVKKEMDLIKVESAARSRKESSASQQYLESQIQKLSVIL
jgi:predicted nuclease with TOPRIM domain